MDDAVDEKLSRAVLFEEQRPHLRAVAYRMLGSISEAEDALQEAWLRYDRTDTAEVENLAGWLTTVVSRVCLNLLRARAQRREEPLEPAGPGGEPGPRIPDPLLRREGVVDPEQEVMLADSVGLALMVVMESLSPAERVAFVLHDMFAVPFDEIAPLIEKTAAATRQLASRARRKVQGQAPAPDPDLGRQRVAVDAFFAAARNGDLGALVAVLDPDVVLRSDGGVGMARHSVVLSGSATVAGQAVLWGKLSPFARPALINGTAGAVVIGDNGRALSIMAFTVVDDAIVAIDVLTDPERLAALDLSDFRDR
ncbi:DNA-directed RNA polymerase sigma-70 factor [Kitasatospora xanthocidica]|uniref:sigma-70 family RNA polymerase sigma factor n=1 Tax=Kitasatospora xanthocidica TaxID=83382 RepID=UPI001676EC6E|nr:sigma-70 family RNA polymerase sigma factor [Kitasatospora xanthocidica]GHF51977.1 DNA-directed RNA polymerase sigma-70 factor [Kitasatospora xanthocidica]